jgi:LPXTG-motif cell wall-anchored protein
MKKLLKIVAPVVLATGLPLVSASVASAVPPLSITSCTMTPSTIALASGQSENITIGWEDGVNTPGGVGDVVYIEVAKNSGSPQGQVNDVAIGPGTNPITVPFSFDFLSSMLSGDAGTVKFSFFATDGTSKVGGELCSLTATVAAAPGSTTTTTVAPTTTVVPTTLPRTGSNTSSLLAGGAMIVAFGGALYVSGRRRSIK